MRSGPPLLGASRLITIDGPAGSGKSTLALQLENELGEVLRPGETRGNGAALGATETISPARHGRVAPADRVAHQPASVSTIHLDDLYEGWTGLNAELFRRLEAEVILPLANSRAARFLVYDWADARYADWSDVLPARYVIIEGVGAGDVVTRKWATTKVWLDVSDESGLRRGLARDARGQSTLRARQELHERWVDWQTLQAEYFANSGNRAAADFSVDTTHM